MLSKYATPGQYGFETRTFALAREWARSGRQVVIASSDSNHLANVPLFPQRYTTEAIGGCVVRWIRTARYGRTASLRRVWSWLDFEWKLLRMPTGDLPRPDVIIASSLSLFTVLTGAWFAARFGAKLVFEVRDIWPLTLTEEGGAPAWHPLVVLMGIVERFGYRRADLIVGTMPNLAEHVRHVAGTATPCACVPFGFDPAAHGTPPHPVAHDTPQPVRLPAGKFIVGYAGSIGMSNALDTVIACARLMQHDERFHFVLLGDGDSRARYVEQTRDLPNVAFPGRIDRTQVQSVLEQCDLLYFAAHDSKVWRYGMSPNKLVDYLMAARPVVASYSGFPSILNEAGCGEFVPAADVGALRDAIVRFQQMPADRRTAMGAAGRQWLVAHRPWPVLAQRYLELLDGACSAPKAQ